MRRFLWLSFAALLLACIAVASSGGATQAEARWVITDLGGHSAVAINDRGQVLLGRFAGGPLLWENGKTRSLQPLVIGSDLNERGQVVGSIGVRGDKRAALWVEGRARNLGTLSGKQCWWTEAIALNDRGQVIGNDIARREDPSRVDAIWRRFLWDKGKMIALGGAGFAPYTTSPEAINNRGQIVGFDTVNDRGFLWQNGRMIDLGDTDPGWMIGVNRMALNDRGQVVFTRNGRVVLFERGRRARTLPTLGKGATAIDITERGTVVGSCAVGPKNLAHPCMWQDGTARRLGTVFGDRGRALAANDRGQVVGFTQQLYRPDGTKAERQHAFVWENGKMTDLGTLPGGKESEAVAINNKGQVIGWSDTKSGEQHAVLWTLKR